ncbi:MAG: XRE family transcriptional regulator [Salinivirgaceae bacterium]|nr:XRE family transcriptional regulator [Salinivirgaceae bacterium]
MEIHCGRLIENELRNQRRSAHWLANELHCDRTNVYKIFKRKNLDAELLMHLSIILQKNFFETLTNETVTEIAKVQNM